MNLSDFSTRKDIMYMNSHSLIMLMCELHVGKVLVCPVTLKYKCGFIDVKCDVYVPIISKGFNQFIILKIHIANNTMLRVQ